MSTESIFFCTLLSRSGITTASYSTTLRLMKSHGLQTLFVSRECVVGCMSSNTYFPYRHIYRYLALPHFVTVWRRRTAVLALYQTVMDQISNLKLVSVNHRRYWHVLDICIYDRFTVLYRIELRWVAVILCNYDDCNAVESFEFNSVIESFPCGIFISKYSKHMHTTKVVRDRLFGFGWRSLNRETAHH